MSTVDEYHKYQDWTQAASGLEGVQVPPQRVAPPQQDAAKAD